MRLRPIRILKVIWPDEQDALDAYWQEGYSLGYADGQHDAEAMAEVTP